MVGDVSKEGEVMRKALGIAIFALLAIALGVVMSLGVGIWWAWLESAVLS